MPDEPVIINFKVPEEINAWLEGLAESQLTSKSAVIRGMILNERKRIEEEQNNADKTTARRHL